MTATERMPVVEADEVVHTPGEPWKTAPGTWYGPAADFACERLGRGDGKECLVIGSPLPEVRRLQEAGWWTWLADVRVPPLRENADLFGTDRGSFCFADATALPFDGARFDAVSSTCVLCHAGLGRYGDPVKPNGDVLMLREIARVLKPGGLAAVMAGPALADDVLKESVVYGNVHRVYRPADVLAMARAAGLECPESVLFVADEWVGAPDVLPTDDGPVAFCYLSVLLRKPA